MIRIPKDRRPLHAELVAAGAELTLNGSGHLRYRLPNGSTVVMPSTPGDRRGLHRARADVRRALTPTSKEHAS